MNTPTSPSPLSPIQTTPTAAVLGDRCRPCVMHDLRGAMELLGYDAELRDRIERRAEAWVADTIEASDNPASRLPSFWITGVHRILKEEARDVLPFAALRQGCNEVGLELAGRIADEVASLPSSERFRTLCQWAIAGNHLDFRTAGIGYGFGIDEIETMLREVVARGLDLDQTAEIERLARGAERVLFIPDNVGEIAFDALLVRELRSYGAHVVVPYRGGPITSDAILDDFAAVGLDDAASEIFEAGPDTLGISLEEASERLTEEIARADLVITKGQANFYVAYGRRGRFGAAMACLLTTKCDLISETFGTTRRLALATVMAPPAAAPQSTAADDDAEPA